MATANSQNLRVVGGVPGLARKDLELRELRSFLSVARIGNIGRAARELQVSQSTISYQMQKLEAGVGAQLLVRHGRGVSLTEAGSCVRDRVDQIIHLLEAPLATGDQVVLSSKDSVVLAAPHEFEPGLWAPLIKQFRADWPTIRLEIREGSEVLSAVQVLDRQVDLAVVRDSSTMAGVEITPVLTEALGLVVAANSPLADHTGTLSFRDASGQELILPRHQHWIRRKLEQAAYQAGVRFDPPIQVDGTALVTSMVREGLGSSILPASTVQDELRRGMLVFRPIARPALSTVVAIASRSGETSQAIIALVRLLSAALAPGGPRPGVRVTEAPGAIFSEDNNGDQMV